MKNKLHDHPMMQSRFSVLSDEVIVDKEFEEHFPHNRTIPGLQNHIIVKRADFEYVYHHLYYSRVSNICPKPDPKKNISIDSL